MEEIILSTAYNVPHVDDPDKQGIHTVSSSLVAKNISPIKASVVETPRKPTNDRYRRMRRSSYQARLGRKLDKINNKIIDNDIRLTAHPTDMIRVEAVRDERSGDLISRVIKSTEVMPILLPEMKDIPLRHLIRDNRDILVPSLYSIAQEEYFEMYSPIECDLNEDDLLVRILYDTSPEINDPYVLVFQVKEVLATFGYSSIMWKKLICTFYDEALPQQVVNALKQCISKREALDW